MKARGREGGIFYPWGRLIAGCIFGVRIDGPIAGEAYNWGAYKGPFADCIHTHLVSVTKC